MFLVTWLVLNIPLELQIKGYPNQTVIFQKMESDGVLTIYKRSTEKHRLRYRPYIGDGDSSSYSRVVNEAPYGVLLPVPKAECCVHVTRRMGTGLRTLIKENKGIYIIF